MANKDEFKNFARRHPELIKYVKNGDSTWQKFYELYDIYGDNENAWSTYLRNNGSTQTDNSFKSITDKLKNIDLNSIQEHINTAQKALGIVQELTGKGASVEAAKDVIEPRPVNKIFED